MPTKIYEYGLLPPVTNADVVEEQMSLAHKYQNKLVEIELFRRKKVRELLAKHDDAAPLEAEVAALVAELTAIRETINARRKETRSAKTAVVNTLRANEVKRLLREKRKELREVKDRVAQDEAVAKEIDAWNEWAATEHKRERAASGVYWGTYLLVEQWHDAARKGKDDPKFRRWRGHGSIGVHVANGMSVEQFNAPNTLIYVDPLPTEGGKRKRARTMLYVRVASENRKPVFAAFPIMLSRPIPEGYRIKNVRIIRRAFANVERWLAHVVISRPDVVVDVPALPEKEMRQVGVDVGWRQLPNGSIRVAHAVGDDGQNHELRLPAAWREKVEHARSLRSIRDKNLDEAKARIAEWIEERGAAWNAQLAIDGKPGLPEAAHVRLWRRAGRVKQFLTAYGALLTDERRGYLEAWHKQDLHLWQWEVFELRRCDNQRREMFRLFAKEIASRYDVVRLERFDLRVFAQRGDPEDGATTDRRQTSANRVLANVSGFRTVLESAVASQGGRVVKLDAAWTTKTCAWCGHVDEWDAGQSLNHTCSSCGRSWDQDANAARNLLRAELPEGALATKAAPSGRFARAKAAKAAKAA